MSRSWATLAWAIPCRQSCTLKVVGLVILLCGIAGGSAVHRMNSAGTKSVPLTETDRSAEPRRIHALGRLEPAGTVLKISPRSGNEGARVESLLVREGDDVAAGSVLAVLDNESLRQAVLAEAEARLSLAKTKLAQVQAGAKASDIGAQQLTVDVQAEQKKVAERELKRAQELRSKNVITTEEMDNKQWLLDRVSLEHRRAQELLKSIREVRDIDVRVAEQDVAAAQAAVRRAQVDVDATKIFAPSAGRVLKIHTHAGERIGDQGLLEMGDVLHMEAVGEVFEADVAQLQTGLKAMVRVDCLREPISGLVSDIGHRVARKAVLTNDPVSDTDARVVEVRIRLSPDEVKRVARLSNARVEVSIELPAE